MSSSPAAPAVENVLGLFAEDEVSRGVDGQFAPYHVFSYQEDFYYLWGIGGRNSQSLGSDVGALDQKETVVLVDDGIPDMPASTAGPDINVRDYITAYDWAIYFFLSCLSRETTPDVRLCILDVTAGQSGSSFAAQRLPSLLPLMPWLQIYRLSSLTDLQARFGNVGIGAAKMAAELAGGEAPSLRDTIQKDPGVVDAAKKLASEAWERNLTKPEGRHDVSNLTAPLLLASGLRSVEGLDANKALKTVMGKDPRRMVLVRLLQSLGMLRDQEESEEPVFSPLDTPMVENDIFGQFDHVQFLLVDDQARLGYYDILASLLAGENEPSEDSRFSLQATTGPQPLVESLFGMTSLLGGSEEEWDQPRVLDATGEGEEFDVLLLDLRLFGDAITSEGGEEEDFFKRLVEFYEESGAESIGDDRLDRAAKAAQKREEDAAGLMHLALLPLLLSYVDPSLPIVLFSSTRQQAVIEALSHQPNIITLFRKPVVSGYDEETTPRDYVARLSDALTEALRLHEARCVWRRVERVEWSRWPVFEVSDQMVERGEKWIAWRETEKNERYEWVKNVYNYHGKLKPRRGGQVQRDAGEMEPRIQGRAMRSRLAKYYEHYVAGSNYWDFSVVPSSFLEEKLVPDHLTKDPNVNNVRFKTPVELDLRNHVRRILRTIRNRVAHGYASPPESRNELGNYRLAAVLCFLILLDFIEEESSQSPADAEDKSQQMERMLRGKYKHLGKFRRDLEPRNLMSDAEIEYLEAVAFVACYQVEKSIENNQVMLTNRTVTAIRRLTNSVLANSSMPEPHPDPASKMDTGERVIGAVQFTAENDSGNLYGFIDNPKPGGQNGIYISGRELEGKKLPRKTLVEFTVVKGREGPAAKNVQRLT